MQNDSLSRFGEALVALPVELASRRRYDHTPEVNYVRSSHDAPGLPGGSICVVSGITGTPLLEQVRAHARKGDASAVAKLLSEHDVALSKRVIESREERREQELPTGEVLTKIPSITEVRYRGKSVAEGMITHPEMKAMRVLIPYAGGRLDPEGFVASTYVHGERASEVDTIVIVREPELSAIEQKVLDRLPEEVNQIVLGDPGSVANWGLLAAGLVFAFVYFVGPKVAEYAKEQMQQKEREHQREMERQIEGNQQQEQQQEQQGEQQQEQQGQGEQQQEKNANSGSLSWFVDEVELAGELEDLAAGAAVQTLVQLRTSLMMQGQLR
jgi:hypothetical protein